MEKTIYLGEKAFLNNKSSKTLSSRNVEFDIQTIEHTKVLVLLLLRKNSKFGDYC